MPAANAQGGGRRKRRKTTRGPQGLPIQGTSPARPVRVPKPLIQGVTRTVRRDKKVMRAARRRRREIQADLRVSGDRPVPGGRTRGIDATRSPEFKAALRYLVQRERDRLRLDATVRSDRPAPSLHNELAALRNTEVRRGSSYFGLKHPNEYYDKRTGKKLPVAVDKGPWKGVVEDSALKKADMAAPVEKVLEQTTRPLHAVAGAADAALHGKNIPKAALRGLKNKDKKTFGEVLHGIGVPRGIANVAGFGLDFVADPLTHGRLGTGSLASRGASKAASRIARKTPKAPIRRPASAVTRKEATRAMNRSHGGRANAPSLAERARQRQLRHGDQSRGITVKVVGKEVPGVRRATAKAGKAAKKVTPKPVRRAGRGGRHIAADFNPNIVPDGLTRRRYEEIRAATRTARSTSSRAIFVARQQARAIQKEIGAKNYQRVLDAIESRQIRALPENLQKAARFLDARFKYIRRLEKRAGVKGATIKGYVPHLRTADLIEDRGMGVQSVGRRQIRPQSSKRRQDRRTLAEIREESAGKYIEDPGVLYAARMAEGAMSVTRAEFNRRLASAGRPLRRGRAADLAPDEAVYHIVGSDIRRLDLKKDAAEIRRVVDEGGKKGQYVVLNEQATERALKTITPAGERSTSGMVLDRVQGGWKLLATQPNPGFHLRNLAGGIQNAYLAESGHRLTRNLAQSARALHHLNKQERAHNVVGKMIDPTDKGIQVGGKRLTYTQLIAEAERVGAIRSGFAARELHDLLENKGKVRVGVRFQELKRIANNVEDATRLATYIGGRKRGLTPEQASARAARFHFDYSDLTELERKVLRRVMPFYTFSARNIPLQMRVLISQPGKFAAYQKIREEFAHAFGIDLDMAESESPERERRSAPVFVRIGGRRVGISLGPSGLPLTDLNEFPTTANPIKQADEWMNRAASLLTPAVKTPVELWANLSFFFRDQIERDQSPLVPMSSVVAEAIPAKFRKELGIVPDYRDSRTGSRTWGAPARIVYAMGVLPGPFNYLNRVTTKSDREGQSPKERTLGYLGIRAVPVDPLSTTIEELYEERGEISKAKSALNQRGIYVDSPTPEYLRLNEREKALTERIMRLRTKRGDVINSGRPSTRTFGDPAIDAGLEKLRKQTKSRFAPEIEKALEKIR